MAKMSIDAAGIATISGAMLKPKKQDGHSHGNYLIAVHRTAPTSNPNCQRVYSKRPDAYKRNTPVTADEQVARARFAAIARAVKNRKADLGQVATDLAAFKAQKDTGYKTMRQYLWHVCADQYDQNNG